MSAARIAAVAAAPLLLGAAARAQVTEAAPAAPSPEQRFEALLVPYRDAEAIEARLHFRGEVTPPEGDPRVVADVAMHLRFALPDRGSLEMRGEAMQGETGELSPFRQDLVGAGGALYYVDHEARTVRTVGATLTKAYELWIDLVPFRAFARQELAPWRRIYALPADPERSGLEGFSVRYPYYRVAYWFDAEGRLRRGRLEPETDFLSMVPSMDFEVAELRLHPRAAELAFSPRLPAGYEELATP